MNAMTKPKEQIAPPAMGDNMPPVEDRLIVCLEQGGDPQSILDDLKAERLAEAEGLDMDTREGRDALRKLAAALPRIKTAVDAKGKAMTAGWREQTAGVNAIRSVVGGFIDTFKAEVRKPLSDWEAVEAKHIEASEAVLDEITEGDANAFSSSEAIQAQITKIEGIELGAELGGFLERAAENKASILAQLKGHFDLAAGREKQEAEIAKLKADAAEHARLREEAEAKAEIAAMQAAQALLEKVQAEEAAQRAEVAARQASEEREAEDKRREQQSIEDAEAARVQAIEDEAIEAIRQKEADEAKRLSDIEDARVAEEKRVQAIADAEAAKRREEQVQADADLRIKEAADKAADVAKAMEALRTANVARLASRIDEVQAEILKAIDGKAHDEVARLIVRGEIPHVTITLD
jgi:hypothetical protein